MFSIFRWLAATDLSQALAQSQWAFAITEIVHLLALALAGGAILFFDLRLLGLGLRNQSKRELGQALLPLAVIGVAAMIVSGVAMVASGPMRYYFNPAFRIKMYLFIVALIFHFGLHLFIARREDGEGFVGLDRAAGALSLVLWISIGVAGRAIGFV